MLALELTVSVPPIEEVLASGPDVPVMARGTGRWVESVLGEFAKEKGVYVLHQLGEVRYVGKPAGDSMSFGWRLRREFQESASQGRHVYPYLARLNSVGAIRAHLIPIARIREFVKCNFEMSDADYIATFEAALIAAYKPEFQGLGNAAKLP